MRFMSLLISAGVAFEEVVGFVIIYLSGSRILIKDVLQRAAPALTDKRAITNISCDPFLDNNLWWGAYNEGIPPAIAEIQNRSGKPKSLAPHTCRRGACNTLNSAVVGYSF
jgi:hypothetical protein